MDRARRASDAACADAEAPAPPADDPLWYKDAVIYQLHVKAFFDSNDDGIGDFRGLTEQARLHPGAGRQHDLAAAVLSVAAADDGYDVADYHNVHPQYGTRDDFRHFVREAHRARPAGDHRAGRSTTPPTSIRGSRPRAARRAGSRQARLLRLERRPDSSTPARASSSPTPRPPTGPGTRSRKRTTGTASSATSPTSTSTTRSVLKAVIRTMRFWLDMGVDGFRLDAIPYLFEREGTNNENLPETHAVIKQIRAVARRALPRTACCSPRPTSGPRTCASTSATATSATWPTTSR